MVYCSETMMVQNTYRDSRFVGRCFLWGYFIAQPEIGVLR